MNIFKLITKVVLLASICFTTTVVAQTGGRKKEHRNQRSGSLFHRKKSSGHADAFAKGGNHKSFFARVFKGKSKNGPWVYKKTNPGLKQNKEQSRLFSRNRTKAKQYRDGMLVNQKKKRAKNRQHSSFTKKKR